MARMHSGKKGKSGSTKPAEKKNPSWMRYKAKEVEMLITKVAKEEKSPSKIGLILRDSYGIPDVKTITQKSISKILAEKKLLGEIPEDLLAVIKKNIQIRKHLEENRQDVVARRGLELAESKIKRLVKYYKASKKLPQDWKYDPNKIRLMID